MYSGILLAIGTGLIWTFIGIIMSHCNRSKTDFKSYYAANMIFTILLTLIVYTRWEPIFSGSVMDPYRLSIFIIGSGIVNAIGIIVMQTAMKHGHNGLIWAIGQSALIIPFLCGILIFGENGSLAKFTGVAMILAGMMIPSVFKNKSNDSGKNSATNAWLKLTFLAFILFGAGQTLQSVPSYWQGWIDNANIRPTLGCIGSLGGVVFAAIFLRHNLIPDRKTLLLALGMAGINTLSVKLFYVALDQLSSYGMASICFPLIVGSCIFGFSFYSLFIIREKSGWHNWSGLVLTITGIFTLSF